MRTTHTSPNRATSETYFDILVLRIPKQMYDGNGDLKVRFDMFQTDQESHILSYVT